MLNLSYYNDRVRQLCEQLHVKELELFGSATRADFTANSDIDILVTFEGTGHLFQRYFDLKEGLEKIFDRDVDVIMTEAIRNPFLQQRINEERVSLYAA